MESIGATERAAELDTDPELYFQDWLVMNSGVYLNPGSTYGKGGPGNMRFNLGSSRKVVKDALDHLAEAVNNA
jgi:bifunctional pyridoxal-dependent enzyme with beta-cystathionase and maltose regulon repressor activities